MKRSFDEAGNHTLPKKASTPITKRPNLELWGGLECTYNRVHDTYFNQMEWNGHLKRPEDLDRFAALGIRAIRYPVIWEMMAPQSTEQIDWSFADERLPRLRELGVRPIADLVHHGSGPAYALIDTPQFAESLARFARAVAERFPWVDAYTPVNEQLTTARFCGMYGHWYPHGTNDVKFARILANECRATILSMRAIREVNPQAQLVQTDDLGRVYSTPRMRHQAEYENHRRWLGWDLLCGKVNSHHPMWRDLLAYGLTETELGWFEENACPPNVVGINYYPTSDRYLDENVELYPDVSPGTNGRDIYVDVEAVRVRAESPGGFHERLMEAWNRYHLPLAITESHLGCTREEQIRWFAESWKAAERAREDGADVRAVTAWSLLGAYNWNTLVTRDANYYEPGVFDVRGPQPRPTAIANLLRSIGAGEKPDHPALQHPGWWHRPERLFAAHRALLAEDRVSSVRGASRDKASRPLLILGANGTLGRAFVEACEIRGLAYHAFSRPDLDLSDAMAVEVALEEVRPWAVINAAGYVRIDDAENDEKLCFEINTEAASRLAVACEREGSALLCFSSDLVFDGQKQSPYLETDKPSPLSTFGRSKAAMESRVFEALPTALIARTGAFYGPHDEWNKVTQTLRALSAGERVTLPEDVMVSPTFVPHLVEAAFDLLIDGAHGLWHLTNAGQTNWAELARLAARKCGVSDANLVACTHSGWKESALRPRYRVLGTERGQILPSFEAALSRYAREVKL